MIYRLLISFLISFGCGFTFIGLLWPEDNFFTWILPIKIFLSICLGCGISFCFYFLWLILGFPQQFYITAESALFVLLVLIYICRFFMIKTPQNPELNSIKMPKSWETWVLLAVFTLLLAFSILSFSFQTSTKPHGDWDAWASWNLRAKFLFRGGKHWERAFSEYIPRNQGNYPPLLPILITRGWMYMGIDTVDIPIAMAALFTFALIGLGMSTLLVMRGWIQGLLCGIVMLGTPFLITHGGSQYADIPFAFFFLAMIVMLAIYCHWYRDRYGILVLLGLIAGFCACTKNEGISIVLWMVIFGVIYFIQTKKKKKFVCELSFFVIGLILPIFILIYFKLFVAAGKAHLADLTVVSTLAKLSDLSRYTRILQRFIEELIDFKHWMLFPLILPFYILVTGIEVGEGDRFFVMTTVMLLAVIFFTFFGVYLITNFDLNWLLKYSPDRVFMELWPTMIFTCFFVTRTPKKNK